MLVEVFEQIGFEEVRHQRAYGQIVLRLPGGEDEMDLAVLHDEVATKDHLGKIATSQRKDALNGNDERVSVPDEQLRRERTGADMVHQVQCFAAHLPSI